MEEKDLNQIQTTFNTDKLEDLVVEGGVENVVRDEN